LSGIIGQAQDPVTSLFDKFVIPRRR
jgi:hypothetical protein